MHGDMRLPRPHRARGAGRQRRRGFAMNNHSIRWLHANTRLSRSRSPSPFSTNLLAATVSWTVGFLRAVGIARATGRSCTGFDARAAVAAAPYPGGARVLWCPLFASWRLARSRRRTLALLAWLGGRQVPASPSRLRCLSNMARGSPSFSRNRSRRRSIAIFGGEARERHHAVQYDGLHPSATRG